MAVGDPHQAIYGWRGASAGNLGGFPAAFSPERRVRAVLAPDQLAQQLARADRRERRARAAGGLRARRRAGRCVRALLRPAGAVETRLRRRPRHRGRPRRGVVRPRPRDRAPAERRSTTGAILFRSKKHMVRFGDALGRRGIPHRILGLGRTALHPRSGGRRVRAAGAQRPERGVGAHPAARRDRAGRSGCPICASSPPSPDASRGTTPRCSRWPPRSSSASAAVPATTTARSWTPSTSSCATSPITAGSRGFTPEARERLREAASVFAGLRRAVGMPMPDLVRLIELELRLDVELAANEIARARAHRLGAAARVRRRAARLPRRRRVGVDLRACSPGSTTRSSSTSSRPAPSRPRTTSSSCSPSTARRGWSGMPSPSCGSSRTSCRARRATRRGGSASASCPTRSAATRAGCRALRWERDVAPTQQDLKAAIDAFVAANRARQLEEDRRLAYVAVTRARDHLLLTGRELVGHQATARAQRVPRARSPTRSAIELADGRSRREPVPRRAPGAAVAHRSARRAPRGRASARPPRSQAAAAPPRATPDPRCGAAARRARRAPARRRRTPRRRASPHRGTRSSSPTTPAPSRGIARPLPERPFRQTRLGTLFHAWVEQRSGRVGTGALARRRAVGARRRRARRPTASAEDAAVLGDAAGELRRVGVGRTAARSRSRPRSTSPTAGLDGRPHVVICKLDAVYRRDDRGGRIEIVDWKTGAPPRTDAETGRADAAARAVPPGLPRDARRAARRDRRRAVLRRATTWCCAADATRGACSEPRSRRQLLREPATQRRVRGALGVRLRVRGVGAGRRRRVGRVVLALRPRGDVDRRRGDVVVRCLRQSRRSGPRSLALSRSTRRRLGVVGRRPTATALRGRTRRCASRCRRRRAARSGTRSSSAIASSTPSAASGTMSSPRDARRERLEQADGVVDDVVAAGLVPVHEPLRELELGVQAGALARTSASGARPLCAT